MTVALPIAAYAPLLEWRCGGQTLGKKLLHLRVVRVDGSPVTFRECRVRGSFLLVDYFLLTPLFGLILLC